MSRLLVEFGSRVTKPVLPVVEVESRVREAELSVDLESLPVG